MSDPHHVQLAKRICAARGLIYDGEVGSGAFKHSFRVHISDGSRRALKVYRAGAIDARTLREVEAIKKCNHPNIAQFELLETWTEGAEHSVFSLEEYLAGGTLSQRLGAKGSLTRPELQLLGSALIEAVAHVAGLDLVHRDIKPDNIMFRSEGGDPVLVDFGLVRDLGQPSLTNTWLDRGPGTPFFSSPEQLQNDKPMIDWRTDQFALGIVLAICGSGAHPYALQGMKHGETVDRVASREPLSPDFISWASANNLKPLVRMTAAWPVSRYRTAAQLAADWRSVGGTQ